jgi:hypothetical protein
VDLSEQLTHGGLSATGAAAGTRPGARRLS